MKNTYTPMTYSNRSANNKNGICDKPKSRKQRAWRQVAVQMPLKSAISSLYYNSRVFSILPPTQNFLIGAPNAENKSLLTQLLEAAFISSYKLYPACRHTFCT